jgi:hypothetical protein
MTNAPATLAIGTRVRFLNPWGGASFEATVSAVVGREMYALSDRSDGVTWFPDHGYWSGYMVVVGTEGR